MNKPMDLGELLERGGVYYEFPGNTVQGVLDALVESIPIPPAIQAQDLLLAVKEREALMSTSIGEGIALPHPRNPLATKIEDEFVALVFLKNQVDWKAMDAIPVDTLFFIVSSSAKSHLKTLSSISFFCKEEAFLKLLASRASKDNLIKYIKDTEQKWEG